MKIVADGHLPYVDEFFGRYGDIKKVLGRDMQPDTVEDADILLVRSVTKVNAELLQHSRVKFVGSMTAGADHMDTKWLDSAGIKWSTADGFNATPVADYVISTLAALMQRHVLPQKRARIAIIGAGNIGKKVIERLQLLDMEVIVCDPPRARQEPSFKSVSLDEISDVDLISLHVPLQLTGEDATYHFINSDFLKRQKAGCVLLNASRGAVIDSNALLQDGGHLIWCLDVFEDEPEINKQILERAALATPHIAGYSVQSKVRGMEMLYQAACHLGVIAAQDKPPLVMPHQELGYAGRQHRWQDIVLGVFNPAVMTAMMRTSVLPSEHHGVVFDELRNRFQFRHEFAFTKIPGLPLADQDVRILAHLGINLNSN